MNRLNWSCCLFSPSYAARLAISILGSTYYYYYYYY
jgi:hypothetical protein